MPNLFLRSLFAFAWMFSFQSWGEMYTIHKSDSVFAVVTYKKGVASALAHNHVIVAGDPYVELKVPDNGDFGGSEFSFRADVEKLIVDDEALQKLLANALNQLGHSVEFTPLSKSDREKVRVNMVSEEQLFQQKFPLIEAKLAHLKPHSDGGGGRWTHQGSLEVTIRGKTATLSVPARIQFSPGGALNVEAFVKQVSFQEFGIKPYSMLFGAIANQENFSLYAKIQASSKKN